MKIAAAARGEATVVRSLARSRCCIVRWLVAGVACTAAGCTLTDKAFEPSRVDDAVTQGEPALPGVTSPPETAPPAGQESGLPTANNSNEGVPDVRPPSTQMSMLEPGTGEESDAGVPPGVEVAQPDAGETGATVDAGPPVAEPPPVVVEPPAEPCTGLTLGDSCYQAFDSFLTWDAAEQQCVGWGGHLASISSPEENAALDAWVAQLGLSNADGSGIWVGGTDARSDGQFQWVDGSPFSLPGWAAGQPDNGAGVDCIEKRNDGAGRWYDRRCTDSLRYLCERPL